MAPDRTAGGVIWEHDRTPSHVTVTGPAVDLLLVLNGAGHPPAFMYAVTTHSSRNG
jgi:hypothetical protein